MSHAVQYADRRDSDVDSVEAPVSVSHLVRVLRAYSAVIGIALLSVAIGYMVLAILLYIIAPAQRTTVQPFRLEFRGAVDGKLPNGLRFTPTEIVSTPVLLKVFQADELGRFTTFEAFSRSVFVLEANREYEKLVNEYTSRLADPRLSPLDRERIQKEFDSKREIIRKNDYAVSYARTSGTARVPETLVRKVLVDVLNTWTSFAINEQHALDYRVSVLSPQIIDASEVGATDPIARIEILRLKIYRVIDNIEEINELPSAELVKTADHMSLAEIRMRLEDIVRFRLEPLVGVTRASGLVANPAVTIHFLENQLAYDERRLQAARSRVAALREAVAMYNMEPVRVADTTTAPSPAATGARANGAATDETVMPQISDTFLDKLVSISKQASDPVYRQKMIETYQDAVKDTIPLEQAVNYDRQVLDQMRSGSTSSAPRSDERTVVAEIDGATAEVRRLITKVNEIYVLLSRALNPSTQLASLVGPPTTQIERAQSLSRLALYGLVVMLVSLPIIVILCLLHNRMREEDRAAHAGHHPAGEPT